MTLLSHPAEESLPVRGRRVQAEEDSGPFVVCLIRKVFHIDIVSTTVEDIFPLKVKLCRIELLGEGDVVGRWKGKVFKIVVDAFDACFVQAFQFGYRLVFKTEPGGDVT